MVSWGPPHQQLATYPKKKGEVINEEAFCGAVEAFGTTVIKLSFNGILIFELISYQA